MAWSFSQASAGNRAAARSVSGLAAVLAHEIGHVAGKHGLRAIKKSRWADVGTILATEGARTFGSEEVVKLAEELEGSIQDITQTLVNNGYSKELEREADEVEPGHDDRRAPEPRVEVEEPGRPVGGSEDAGREEDSPDQREHEQDERHDAREVIMAVPGMMTKGLGFPPSLELFAVQFLDLDDTQATPCVNMI